MASADHVFPRIICCSKIGGPNDKVAGQALYDIKFWPWAEDDESQVFAAVGSSEIFVCRPRLTNDPPYEVLYWWRDPHEGTSFNSVVWTKDSRSGKPLLCVAGSVPKHITIIDIERGEPVRVLAGHGRNINELMVSPLAPNILASCSEDYTIRLWNLDPDYDRQPCVAMLFGEGHRQPMLASTFHPSGKWIISGGMDTAVALWPVPALHELNDPDAVDQEPRTVYYPHFHSTEVHHNYVDCIAFYGDLIISRCARNQDEKTKSNEILVWKIDGFDSSLPPPPAPPMPEPGVFTRSSFPHRPHTRGFQRLLTLSMPNTDRFYLRFGLLNTRPWRPILCMGSQVSKFCFWDLQKLEEGHDAAEEDSKGSKRKGGARKTKASVTEALLNRLGDLLEEARLGKVSSASDGSRDTATPRPSSASISTSAERRSYLEDPTLAIPPHYAVVANTEVSSRYFATYAMDWSPDGHWLVGVGDFGTMVIFHRDRVA